MHRRLKLFSVGKFMLHRVHPGNAGNFCVLFLSNLATYIVKCVETTLFWKLYGSAGGFGVLFS